MTIKNIMKTEIEINAAIRDKNRTNGKGPSPSKVTTHGPEIIASLWSLISVTQRLNKHQVGVDVL